MTKILIGLQRKNSKRQKKKKKKKNNNLRLKYR